MFMISSPSPAVPRQPFQTFFDPSGVSSLSSGDDIEAHTRVLLVSDFEQRVAKLEAEDKQ